EQGLPLSGAKKPVPPLSESNKARLKEASKSIRDLKSQLHGLLQEEQTLQIKSCMPKKPVSVVGHFLSESREDVTSGVLKWSALSPQEVSRYASEADIINLRRRTELLKWSRAKKNRGLVIKLEDFRKRIRKTEEALRTAQGNLSSLKEELKQEGS
ncbi:Hypothetical protein FKW44_022394, partial [Caligus rogercresseyi]